jgi:hypothetical protein
MSAHDRPLEAAPQDDEALVDRGIIAPVPVEEVALPQHQGAVGRVSPGLGMTDLRVAHPHPLGGDYFADLSGSTLRWIRGRMRNADGQSEVRGEDVGPSEEVHPLSDLHRHRQQLIPAAAVVTVQVR